MIKKCYFSLDCQYRFTVTSEKMLFTATLRIVVLEKSRPIYNYRFTFIIIKNVIFCQVKIMVLDKSRPTYHYRLTVMVIKMLFFARLKLWSWRNLDPLITIDLL